MLSCKNNELASHTLRVPASSANLGPGFDALGMALGVYLECQIQPADKLRIAASGRDVESISTASDNLIWATACSVAAQHGKTMPAVALEIRNNIPLGKGLGSSAAALVAGVALADRLAGLGLNAAQVVDIAAGIEGHPDNVAACVYGSIVASASDELGAAHVVRISLHERFGIGVVVPDFLLPTVKARRVLPDSYSRRDAIFNVQRSALLVAALATGTVDAFPTALEDRIHQPYRAALVPGLDEIIRLRVAGLLGCALSGAGPSILVFYEHGSDTVCEVVREVFKRHGHHSEVVCNQLAVRGYEWV